MELISKDEAIVMLEDMEGRRDEDGYIRVYKCDVIDNLRSLPTVEERKEGRWIDAEWEGDKCSLCGWSIDDTYYSKQFNYCPNCGAKMKGE